MKTVADNPLCKIKQKSCTVWLYNNAWDGYSIVQIRNQMHHIG